MPQSTIGTSEKHASHKDWSLQVLDVGPTWALTWLLNSVSAACWGGWNWQMLQNVIEDRGNWNNIQTTSNGDTDDFCIRKGFSCVVTNSKDITADGWCELFNKHKTQLPNTEIWHQDYLNMSTDLISWCSKCFLLGLFCCPQASKDLCTELHETDNLRSATS